MVVVADDTDRVDDYSCFLSSDGEAIEEDASGKCGRF